jgi:hypothetical protein
MLVPSGVRSNRKSRRVWWGIMSADLVGAGEGVGHPAFAGTGDASSRRALDCRSKSSIRTFGCTFS